MYKIPKFVHFFLVSASETRPNLVPNSLPLLLWPHEGVRIRDADPSDHRRGTHDTLARMENGPREEAVDTQQDIVMSCERCETHG